VLQIRSRPKTGGFCVTRGSDVYSVAMYAGKAAVFPYVLPGTLQSIDIEYQQSLA